MPMPDPGASRYGHMMIAYLVNQFPQTSQSFIRREIAGLVAAGVQVQRFTLRRWDGPLADPADEAERRQTRAVLDAGTARIATAVAAEMVFRPLRFARSVKLAIRAGRASNRGVLRHLIYLAEACALRRWLTECGAMHLHAHFGTNSTTVAMLCRELGGPAYSFTAHGPEEFDAPAALSLGEKIDRSAFVVAVSWYGRAQLCRWCRPESWGKIHVIHCGVDEEFLQQNETPVAADSRFVCVGRLEEQKGQLLLLDAVAELAARGISMQLTLIGDGSMRDEIERRIREKGLEGSVRLAGWRSAAEVREEILASRALVLPSFAEGLPVVIMEALALCRPVIATAVAGVPELVENGVTGWLVPPGSTEALVGALGEAIGMNGAKLLAMGREGRVRVAKNHDAACEAGKLSGLFGAR